MSELTPAQKKKIISFVLALILLAVSYFMSQYYQPEALEDQVAVHYIDADQGDSILSAQRCCYYKNL